MSRNVEREAVFKREFLQDLRYWVKVDRSTALRLLELVEGIGKPELLRHEFAGCWSRRITQEHRLVNRVSATTVEFLQARYHY